MIRQVFILCKKTFEGHVLLLSLCDLDLWTTDLGLGCDTSSQWDTHLYQVIWKSIHKWQNYGPDTTISSLYDMRTKSVFSLTLSLVSLMDLQVYYMVILVLRQNSKNRLIMVSWLKLFDSYLGLKHEHIKLIILLYFIQAFLSSETCMGSVSTTWKQGMISGWKCVSITVL